MKNKNHLDGCCDDIDIIQTEGAVYTPNGWRVRYILTICDNCGSIKARSNFYDAEERI